jgi:Plavaka transposase
MLVSIIAGSNKTVASVATGHQEFHPVYVGPSNIDNLAMCFSSYSERYCISFGFLSSVTET